MPTNKAGKHYAAGSHSTRDGYEEQKLCAVCGGPIRVSKDSFVYETDLTVSPPLKRGWHVACGRPVRAPE